MAPGNAVEEKVRSAGDVEIHVRAFPPVGRPRYAIPFFLGPHLDTEIACLPTCQGPDNPAKFPPITYDAYLHWWYDANYNARVQDDVATASREG